MNHHSPGTVVQEDEIVNVTLQTPGGLVIETELDALPSDIVRSIFDGHVEDAGRHLRKMTGLPVQIARKVVLRFD